MMGADRPIDCGSKISIDFLSGHSMDDLRSFLSQHNIPNTEKLIPSGEIIRFDWHGTKKDGWFIGFTNNFLHKPGQYICAVFGSWKDGSKLHYLPEKLTANDKAIAKQQVEQAQKKIETEKKIKQAEAAAYAKAQFDLAKTDGEHPYLLRKKITELHGARLLNDAVLIPMQNAEGKLTGLQRIFSDGQKRFISGQANKGSFHVMGDLDDPEIFIVEGYADAAAIRQAIDKTVVVAFSAHSMKDTVVAIKRRNISALITVCGDGDEVGKAAAEKAAAVIQCAFIIPRGEGVKDWNDLYVNFGADEVRRQLFETAPCEDGFIPLGYDESTHFYYHVRSNDILKISGFSKRDLFEIAPLSFWENAYPAKAAERCDWNKAIDDLIQSSRSVGPFDSRRVRGVGVWLDDGRVVLNTGSKLIVDRKETTLSGIKSSYFYVQTVNRLGPIRDPLSICECQPLITALDNLKWRDKTSGKLLAGWLAISRIAGALPIRPHVWVTGGSGTGKSTLMENLVAPCLGFESGWLYLQGSSTEAGLRQRVKSSSIPIIFDEFETTDEDASKRRLSGLVELMRNSWSSTRGSIIKGSAAGHSVEFQLSFSCLVSSIRIWLTNDADRSRFSILELQPHGSIETEWDALRSSLKKIDLDFGERLFARSASMVPTILQSFKTLQSAFAASVSQRYGQQVGMLMAGYYALLQDEPVSKDEAEKIAAEMEISSHSKDDVGITDEEECLRTLMTTRFEVTQGFAKVRESLEEILRKRDEIKQSDLKSYGIKIDTDGGLLIDQSHVEIKKIFAHTRWQTSFVTSLLRLSGAERKKSVRLSSDKPAQRCVKISPNSLNLL